MVNVNLIAIPYDPYPKLLRIILIWQMRRTQWRFFYLIVIPLYYLSLCLLTSLMHSVDLTLTPNSGPTMYIVTVV